MNSATNWLEPILESVWAGPIGHMGWLLALLTVLSVVVPAADRIGAPETPGPAARTQAAFDQSGLEVSPHAATAAFARPAVPDDLVQEEAALEESEDHDEMLPSPVALPSLTPRSLSGSSGPRVPRAELSPLKPRRLRC